VARREPHSLGRQQIEERIMARRQVLVHGTDHVFVGVRTGHLQHARVTLEDALGPGTEAPGHDHAAVVLERLAIASSDSSTAASMKPTGVDHDDVGGFVGR